MEVQRRLSSIGGATWLNRNIPFKLKKRGGGQSQTLAVFHRLMMTMMMTTVMKMMMMKLQWGVSFLFPGSLMVLELRGLSKFCVCHSE